MEQVTAFKTTDGKLFGTQEEAVGHEKGIKRATLADHITSHCCGEVPNEDMEHEIIRVIDVTRYVLGHWEEILQIMES